MGQRKWTSPAVVSEYEILLGSDEERSKAFVEKVRQRMMDEWEQHFNIMREAEMAAFGDNSYFYLQQQDRLPELASEDVQATMDMEEIPEDLLE